jgi:hypothetical protein
MVVDDGAADLFEARVFCDAGESRAAIYGGAFSVLDYPRRRGLSGRVRQDLQDFSRFILKNPGNLV